MRTVTDVQASFGFCCFCAAVETAVASLAEAMAAVADVTASGSSYSFFAAAETVTDLAASKLSDSCRFQTKKAGFPAFYYFLKSALIYFIALNSL